MSRALRSHEETRAAVLRTFIVLALGAWVIAGTLPGLSLLWNSGDVSWGANGALGFDTDYNGVIRSVTPGSEGFKAGLRAGDRIDLGRTAAEDRRFIAASPARIPAGQQVRFYAMGNGGSRLVTLVSPHVGMPPVPRINLALRTIAAIIFVVVGGALCLLRPSRMTWGFFFYCVGFSPGIAFSSLSRYPSLGPYAAYLIISDLLTAAATVGILIFALEFLREHPGPWRRLLERAAPVIFLAFAWLIIYPDVANILLGVPSERWQELMLVLQGAVLALSIAITIDTYIRGDLENRPRIQWVVVGLIVGILGSYAGSLLLFSSVLPYSAPHWAAGVLLLFNVSLPITVAYAVVRHRVLNITFVASRALVYGVMTFMLGTAFALISYFIGQELEATRLASLLEIIAAIALSFWLESLRNRIAYFIDGIFFHQRKIAMRRIAQTAASMAHAQSEATLDAFLTREPLEALDLASAALFRRAEDLSLQRSASIGWAAGCLEKVEHDDPLALALEAGQEPLRPSDMGWLPAGLPADRCQAAIAMPLVVRRQLVGFVLYGAHRNGADLDPEEVKSLCDLAVAAAAAYDHLRAEALTDEVQALKTQLAAMQAAQPVLLPLRPTAP
ncbi:MAG: GAF domain-containing protein [Candidatus Eremiobacter antarcticus]|nr:GAF domain-containing protein [Candidatus Eremiobacteraeota bacterium]MBC5808645.1 GAF domain-containing protein [Candidatus Eremiobacteraeota bacterium]